MNASDKQAVHLAEALLEYCGLEAEGFQESRKALICLDNEAVLLVAAAEGAVELVGILGNAPHNADFLARLMQRNFQSIAALDYAYAIDPSSGELLMTLSLPSGVLDADTLIKRFLSMADYVAQWMRSLASGSGDIPDPAQVGASDPDAQSESIEATAKFQRV